MVAMEIDQLFKVVESDLERGLCFLNKVLNGLNQIPASAANSNRNIHITLLVNLQTV
ncbi:hypothetical protein D3C85_1347170 [compost metagenome]